MKFAIIDDDSEVMWILEDLTKEQAFSLKTIFDTYYDMPYNQCFFKTFLVAEKINTCYQVLPLEIEFISRIINIVMNSLK